MSTVHKPLTSAHESGRRTRSALGIACLGAIAAALVAASAPGASRGYSRRGLQCKPGVTGTWVQNCGPAAATARFSGKVVRWTSGSCKTVNGVLRLHIGRSPLLGLSPKTKYWEHTSTARRDGVHRQDVYVDWWLGKPQYVLVPPMKVRRIGATSSEGRSRGRSSPRWEESLRPSAAEARPRLVPLLKLIG